MEQFISSKQNKRLKIARNNNTPIECRETTPRDATYYCFVCGEEVYPCNERKIQDGRKKDYYFAHFNDNCSRSVESYLHSIAKTLISAATEINLPDKRLSYSSVEVECTNLHKELRPDVLLDKVLAIEICYTNPKTDKQIAIFKELNLSVVEVDLHLLTMESSLDEIRHAVLEDHENRNYLFEGKSKPSPSNEVPSISPIIGFGLLALGLVLLKKVADFVRGDKRARNTRSRRRGVKKTI